MYFCTKVTSIKDKSSLYLATLSGIKRAAGIPKRYIAHASQIYDLHMVWQKNSLGAKKLIVSLNASAVMEEVIKPTDYGKSNLKFELSCNALQIRLRNPETACCDAK